MANPQSRAQSKAQWFKQYFKSPLGDFYSQPLNRLMLYPFLFGFFLVECFTFWLFYLGAGFVKEFLAFTTVYTLHKAKVYTLCMFGADALANLLMPQWGGYAKRTVGRQWLIWGLGIGAGFILQRTMVKSLIPIYAPDVIYYFMANPEIRLSNGALFAFLLPFWALVVFVTLQVVRAKQRIKQAAACLSLVNDQKAGELAPCGPERDLPAGNLHFASETSGSWSIALANITHITVEDHYCRINYSNGNGLKSKLVRMPLKEMLAKLPSEHFVQTHRSHVVNLGHISRVAKKGRDHKVVFHKHEVELPVSRSRFKQLQPLLQGASGANL